MSLLRSSLRLRSLGFFVFFFYLNSVNAIAQTRSCADCVHPQKPPVEFRNLEKIANELSYEQVCLGVKECGSACHHIAEGSPNRCGLSPGEELALMFYTRSGYSCINQGLRSGLKSEPFNHLTAALNQALDKLPSYEGFVSRGASLPKEILDQHQVGAVLEYKAFTSASTAAGFSAPVRYSIFSKNGKMVMSFSNYSHEREVLFKAPTRFKVLYIRKNSSGGGAHIVMKEVIEGQSKEDEEKEDQELIARLKKAKTIETQEIWSCTQGAPLSEEQKKTIRQDLTPHYKSKDDPTPTVIPEETTAPHPSSSPDLK